MDQEFKPRQQADDLLRIAEDLFGDAARQQAEGNIQYMRERGKADLRMAKKIKATFATQNGKATLDWLIASSVNQPHPTIDDLLAETPENRSLMAGYRAGMNEIILMIAAAIGQAETAAEGDE